MQRTTLTAFIEVCSHNTIANTSYIEIMRWFALSGHNLPALLESIGTYKLREGSASLINTMANDARADIRLSTKVTRIDNTPSEVRVTTDTGEVFTARNAIVTIPMNVINQVDFEPSLSKSRTDAALEKHAGEGFKALLIAKGNLRRFWCCSKSSDCPLISVSNYHYGENESVLIAYGYPHEPIDFSDKHQMQVWMRHFFSGIEILKSLGHSWSEASLSLGIWCTYRPGQVT